MIQTNIEDFVSIYKTICPYKKFIYMSTPITTGPRFIEWYKKVGKNYKDPTLYDYQHKMHVIRMNEIDAQVKAENLLDRVHGLVVNPAEFKIKLTQPEFLAFWTKFIIDHASTVIFTDGWSYSRGCLNEYLVATQYNIPCLDHKLRPLEINDAILEIKFAITTLKGLELSTSSQEDVLRVINEDQSYMSEK